MSKTHATGLSNVKTYVPKPYEEVADGPKLVRIAISETFSGDIAGESTVESLQVVRPDGSASMVAIQRVVGKIGDRSGSFVFQTQGTLEGKTVSATWFVVPRSGTGQLRGLRGEGGFIGELGRQSKIALDYWFE